MKLSGLPEFNPVRDGDMFLIKDGYTRWAIGKTAKEAAEALGPMKSNQWTVWSVHPNTSCQGDLWTYPQNHIPRILAQGEE